jgi:hypothetical protein
MPIGLGAGVAIAGGLGLAGTLLEGNQAANAENNQAAVANSNLEFQQGVYNNQWNFDAPMRSYLTDMFNDPDNSLFFDTSKNQIEHNTQQAVQQGDNALAMSGRSDLAGNNEANALLSQAGQLSSAFQQGQITKANLASGLVSNGSVQQAANGVNTAAAGAAGAYGQEAAMGFQQEGALASGLGSMTGGAMQAWQMGQLMNPASTVQATQAVAAQPATTGFSQTATDPVQTPSWVTPPSATGEIYA